MYSRLNQNETISEIEIITDSIESSIGVNTSLPECNRRCLTWATSGILICLLQYSIVAFLFWNTQIFGYSSDSTNFAAFLTTSSDFVIAVSYFTIPCSMVYIISKRRDLPFNWIFWLFAAFIVCCGLTHFVHIFHNYLPSFLINTVVKLVTSLVSFATAVVMIQLLPMFLKIPSMKQLENEIKERKIAQEKMIESEIAREKQRIENDKAKNLFFANMSHEIRTPLSGIIGLSDLLEKSGSLPPEERTLVHQIFTSGQLLLGIVNDVLDVAKLDEGMVELENIDFFPAECVASIESVLLVKAKEKKIQLIVDMPEEFRLLRLVGDPARLKQIIINLVGNAIKFTKEGYVKIICRVLERRLETTTISINVEDTGIGIPKDRMNRLFKTFTQVDASYTRNYGGTGLGLYIAKEFVELLGGSISVKSEVGVGTTFFVKIPFGISKKVVDLSPPARLPDSFIGAKDKSILVVDDNDINQTVALKMLAYYGFTRTDKASNGEQALLLMKTKRYDLVLMDCMMPVMDGYQATKEWRKYEQQNNLGRIHIIGLTANSLQEDEQLCLTAGMDLYARKPLTRVVLANVLAKYFD